MNKRLKKLICCFMCVLFAFTMAVPSAVEANAQESIRVTVDGDVLSLSQPPVVVGGSTMIPVRAVFEALGADVAWDKDSQTIMSQKDEIYAVMQVDNSSMAVQKHNSSETKILTTAPMVLNNTVLVPVEAVAEALGCTVNWHSDTQTVEILSDELLEGSYNYYANAYISNGTVYYSFLMQPYIYAYDGSKTVSYAAGGPPLGIIVRGDYIYYRNDDNKSIYSINRITGERKILFSKLSSIQTLNIYNGTMYIKGRDSDNRTAIYSLSLEDGISKLVYIADSISDAILQESSRLAFSKDKICIITLRDTELNMKHSHMVLTATMLDTNTGRTQQCFSAEGDSYNSGYATSVTSYKYCPTTLGYQVKGDDLYFYVVTSNTEDGTVSDDYRYYKSSFSTADLYEISKSDYENVVEQIKKSSTRKQNDNWVYNSDSSSVYREDKNTGIRETLISGSNYKFLTRDSDMVVVWQGARKGSNFSWKTTNSYKNAKMFVMDSEGNHLTEINSYADGSGTTSADNDGSLDDEWTGVKSLTCKICNGSGTITCLYCHGSGRAKHVQIGLMGGITEQNCTVCGGAGQRVCSACHGSGVIN